MRGLQPAPAASTARLPPVPSWAAPCRAQAGKPQQAGSQCWSQQEARHATPYPVICCAYRGGSSEGGHQQAVRTQEPSSCTDGASSLQLQLQASQDVSSQQRSQDAASQATRKVLPHHITRKIVAAVCVEELGSIIQGHSSCLNSIHVAAALVKLAKLCAGLQDDMKQGATADINHSDFKHSQSQSPPVSLYPPQRMWHRQRRRRMQPSKDGAVMNSQQSTGHSQAATAIMLPHDTQALVEQLAAELGRRYVQHAPDYITARQHANVCWAFGQLRSQLLLTPAEQVPAALESALLASDAQVLQTANNQELCSMSMGLAYLGHYSPQLFIHVYRHADTRLPSFKPQELSTLAWAASHAWRHHKQAQQQPELRHSRPSDRGNAQQQPWHVGGSRRMSSSQSVVAHAGVQPWHGMATEELLHQLTSSIDHIAQDACGKLQAFKPQELARFLWSCGNVGQLSTQVTSVFAAALPVLQQHASAGRLADVDVSNSVWAYAKLRLVHWGQQLLDTVAPTLLLQSCQADSTAQLAGRPQRPRVLQQYGTQELCNILWACAVLQYHRPLASQLLLEVSRRQHQLSPQSIANVAWAAARLGLRHLVLERTALAHALSELQDHSMHASQHVSNTLWACSSLPASVSGHPSTSEALNRLATAAQAHTQSGRLTPAGLAQLAWATGWASAATQPRRARTAGGGNRSTHGSQGGRSAQQHRQQPWLDHQLSPLPQHSPQGMQAHTHEADRNSCSSNDVSRVNAQTLLAPLVGSVTEVAARHVSALQPQELSVIAQGLSYAQRRSVDRELFAALASAAIPHVAAGRFSPGGLAGMLAAYVRAGASHPPLALAAAQSACANVEQYSTIELANLLWALACMRVRMTSLLNKAAEELLSGVLAHVPHTPERISIPASQPPASQPEQPHTYTSNNGSHCFMDSGFGYAGVEEEEEEEDTLTPRSNASSLIPQLGWEDDDVPQGTDLKGVMHTHSAWLTPGESCEPDLSGDVMVWTILAWAFARSKYHQHQLYSKLAAAVLNDWPPSATHVSSSNSSMVADLHSHSVSAGIQSPADLAAQPQAQHIHGASSATYQHVLSGLTADSLVQLVWAFAVHSHRHELLLHEAAPVLSARILHGSLSTRQVATVAWAYAKLQQYEPQLFQAILQQAMAHDKRYNLRDWLRLVYAFSTLCLPAEEYFYPRLNQLQREDAAMQQWRQSQQQRSPAPSNAFYSQARACRPGWASGSRSHTSSRSHTTHNSVRAGKARNHVGSNPSQGLQAHISRPVSLASSCGDDDEQPWMGRPPQRVTRDVTLLSPGPVRPMQHGSPSDTAPQTSAAAQQLHPPPRHGALTNGSQFLQPQEGSSVRAEPPSAAHARRGVMVAAGANGLGHAGMRSALVAERSSLPVQHHHVYVDAHLGVFAEAPHSGVEQATRDLRLTWMPSTGAGCPEGSLCSLSDGYHSIRSSSREEWECSEHVMQTMATEGA